MLPYVRKHGMGVTGCTKTGLVSTMLPFVHEHRVEGHWSILGLGGRSQCYYMYMNTGWGGGGVAGVYGDRVGVQNVTICT